MKVVTDTDNLGIVALGTFDGIHLGHQAIIAKARSWASQRSLPLTVLTFKNHPQHLFGQAPPLLMTAKSKVDFLAKLGVDQLLMVDFTPQFAQQTGAEFIKWLIERGTRGAVVGYNYTFGRGGTTGAQKLATAPFPVEIVEPVMVEGILASSSAIRSALLDGEIPTATMLLGRPYSLSGTVVRGAARGRTLGLPTANIAPQEPVLLPREGVYIARAHGLGLNGKLGVLNLGPCPTFEQMKLTVELFLPNWEGDLYGQDLSVEFIRYLRPQRRFSSPQALVVQVEADLAELRKEGAVWEKGRGEHF